MCTATPSTAAAYGATIQRVTLVVQAKANDDCRCPFVAQAKECCARSRARKTTQTSMQQAQTPVRFVQRRVCVSPCSTASTHSATPPRAIRHVSGAWCTIPHLASVPDTASPTSVHPHQYHQAHNSTTKPTHAMVQFRAKRSNRAGTYGIAQRTRRHIRHVLVLKIAYRRALRRCT